jgi:hypothetical protein
MLFALTRSNLLRQLPDGNGTIPRLTEIVTASNSISPKADKSEHIFGNCSKMNGYQCVKIFEKKFLVEYFWLTII